MSRFVMVVASLGRYRMQTIQAVQDALGSELTIVAGTRPYDPSIKVLTPADIPMQVASNHYAPGGILWQGLPWREALEAETVVADLNPRVISTWALLLARKAMRRRTALWGHAFPRLGRASLSDLLRGWMRSMADGIISYTRTQADELRALHAAPVYVAPNALYHRREMGFARSAERASVIYVGRLEASKKVALLVEGFALAAQQVPEMQLTIAGDGAELAALQQRASSLPCTGRIAFLGHVDDVERLRAEYSRSFVSVSPGYVGLSITQSLAFGVPMLIARDENHSPEIEAARDGENCVFFTSDDAVALSEALIAFWRNRPAWQAKGPEIAEACSKEYSVEAMAAGIVAAFEGR